MATTQTPMKMLFLSQVRNSVCWSRRSRCARVGGSLNQNGAVVRL